MELPPRMELNSKDSLINTSSTIDRNIHFRLHSSINIITSSFHKIWCNRRMMTDLLKIYRTTINPTLIGLPKNWVERFVHCQVYQGTSHNWWQNSFQLVNRISFYNFFKEYRTIRKRHCQSLYVALSAENVNRKWDVENTFSSENVLSYSSDDECQNSSLLPHLFFVNVYQTSNLSYIPLALP